MNKKPAIEWWQPTARPAYILYTQEHGIEEGPQLGADEVICDCCNADVPYTPVAVIGGSALCPECFERIYGEPLAAVAARQGITLAWPQAQEETS